MVIEVVMPEALRLHGIIFLVRTSRSIASEFDYPFH